MRIIGLCASIMLFTACGTTEDQPGVDVGKTSELSDNDDIAELFAHRNVTMSARVVPAQGATGITLKRVWLAVHELELERVGDNTDDGSTGHGVDEQKLGPFLINLTEDKLDGQLSFAAALKVKPGKFDEIEFDIGQLTPAVLGNILWLNDEGRREMSVVIDGHIDGQPFAFTTGVSMQLDSAARFEVKEGEDTFITLNLDPTRWFIDDQGQRLDPRSESARAAIEDNLRRSIDLFDDYNKDGIEDTHNDN